MEIPKKRTKNSASKRWKFQKPTQRILSPYLYQQKVEIPKPGQKNSAGKRWKFQKPGQKNLFPSPLPAKWWNIAQRGTEKGKENHNEAVARIARKVEQKKGRSSE
ncbi:MAG: hypothetical protein V2G33_07245 [bacterium JZ-2024 1]